MLFGKFHFNGSFVTAAVLPAFKGSTFRGVFGVALKKVVCALKQPECPVCLLRGQCIYSRIFETPNQCGERKPSPPHPFVIEPMPTAATYFEPGDQFGFVLLLFGWANEYLPYFVYAFEEMGKIGLGRRLEGRRGRFKLERIMNTLPFKPKQHDPILESRDNGVLHLVLTYSDAGFGLAVQTTGRNADETDKIGRLLVKTYI